MPSVSIITTPFYLHDVILRFSDFKTNEYVNLIRGKYFNPMEENPIVAWRRSSYYKEGYKKVVP